MVIIARMTATPETPLISVLIPNYNGAACIGDCLNSLRRQSYPRLEVIVVDNDSRDESVEIVRRVLPECVLLRLDRNIGFAGAANAGIRSARGSWIGLLNSDAVASEDWVAECVSAVGRFPSASFIASRILDWDERVYSAGDCYLRAGIGYRRGQGLADREEYRMERRVFSACGCAALYRREVFDELGGFDERFFAYLEDVDLGLRLQAAGREGYYVPQAVVRHHGGMTSGGEFSPLSVRLRTRNSILLPVKSLPARILLRTLPFILISQAVWCGRAIANGRVWSYARGLVEAACLIPAMISSRRGMRSFWSTNSTRLWQSILKSEELAGRDFITASGSKSSRFLRWYFHTLAPARSLGARAPQR